MSDLHPWQDVGARFLAGRQRGLLADGPRVGKTRQAIFACDLVGARSVLAVCPGIARDHWAREFEALQVLPRPTAVIRQRGDRAEPRGVTVVSMDGSRSADVHAAVMEHTWDVMICDEPQFLKEPTSLRTQYVLDRRGFAGRAGRIWFLTGSPLLNHPAELWVMLRTIGCTDLSYRGFVDHFCDYWINDQGRLIVRGVKHVEELRAMLRDVMLRRMWKDVSPDYVEPRFVEGTITPTPMAREELRRLEQEVSPAHRRLVQRLCAGEDVDLSGIPGGLARLRAAFATAKADPLILQAGAWLRRSGEKLVIFAHHTPLVDLLTRGLEAHGAVSIHGVVTPRQRQANIDAFTSDSACRVIVCQDQVARTAIDLCAASTELMAEIDWVPENNHQAYMRVQGPRQVKPVTILTPYIPGSTDEAIVRALARKEAMIDEVLRPD